MNAYGPVVRNAAARNVLLLGIFIRAPFFATGVLLPLHVVQTLGHSYTAAGFVATVVTVCTSISGPWRGRLLDKRGLRPVVAPSVLVCGSIWCVAPFVGYFPLLALVVVAGLFSVPIFTATRAAIIVAVDEQHRRTALSLDSVGVEVSFIVGPLIALGAAAVWPTSWVLFGVELVGVLAGLVLWLANPRLAHDTATEHVPRRVWVDRRFVALCVAAAAATTVLIGSEVTFLAAARSLDAVAVLGVILAAWGLGSIVGGLVYGALHRSVSMYLLLAALAALTAPIALARDIPMLTLSGFVVGLLCAPTIVAGLDQLGDLVPERARGEALGWHGSAMTAGNAIGAPLAGVAIDRGGYGAGFVTIGVIGVAAALTCAWVAASGSAQASARPAPARL